VTGAKTDAGEDGQLRQPRSLDAGPAALGGARTRQGVEGGVLAQPGGPGNAAGQAAQLLAGVGGVGHDMDATAGQRGRHLPAQDQPGRRSRLDVLVHQPGQHRQRHRAGQERQPDHDSAITQLLPSPT
jgi:hypothetical protein